MAHRCCLVQGGEPSPCCRAAVGDLVPVPSPPAVYPMDPEPWEPWCRTLRRPSWMRCPAASPPRAGCSLPKLSSSSPGHREGSGDPVPKEDNPQRVKHPALTRSKDPWRTKPCSQPFVPQDGGQSPSQGHRAVPLGCLWSYPAQTQLPPGQIPPWVTPTPTCHWWPSSWGLSRCPQPL